MFLWEMFYTCLYIKYCIYMFHFILCIITFYDLLFYDFSYYKWHVWPTIDTTHVGTVMLMDKHNLEITKII